MAIAFPLEYDLDSGTKVTVLHSGGDTYEFMLQPTDGTASSFTYHHNRYTKAEWDARLEFEQLDALREFWLKTEDEI